MTVRPCLTEEEILDLLKKLSKLDEGLTMCNDSSALTELMDHLEKRLREIAWELYQKKHGLEA